MITGLAPVSFWMNRFNSMRMCSLRRVASDSVSREAPAIVMLRAPFSSPFGLNVRSCFLSLIVAAFFLTVTTASSLA